LPGKVVECVGGRGGAFKPSGNWYEYGAKSGHAPGSSSAHREYRGGRGKLVASCRPPASG